MSHLAALEQVSLLKDQNEEGEQTVACATWAESVGCVLVLLMSLNLLSHTWPQDQLLDGCCLLWQEDSVAWEHLSERGERFCKVVLDAEHSTSQAPRQITQSA